MLNINPVRVVNILKKRVLEKFYYSDLQKVGVEDEEFASILFEHVCDKFENRVIYEEIDVLDFISDDEDDNDEVCEDGINVPEDDGMDRVPSPLSSDYLPSSQEDAVLPVLTKSFKNKQFKKLGIIGKYATNLKEANVNNFLAKTSRKFKCAIHLVRKGISFVSGTNTRYAVNYLKSKLLEEFKNHRNRGLQIHDYHLKSWALKFSKTLNIESFKASKHFVDSFKKINRIASRKVTKFTSTKSFGNEEEVKKSAEKFVNEINKMVFDKNNTWNTDQSKFEYEMTGNRTLSTVGEKHTEATVQSINATTHSYSIQVHISQSGRL